MRTLLIYLFLGFSFFYFSTAQAQRDYADHSVLSEGQWVKLGVTTSGVYKLDQSYLSSLGINTSVLDPKTIRIFGNGGGMLPQANVEKRADDLLENAIFVSGEADGNFDGGDYLLFYAEGPSNWEYDAVRAKFSHRMHLYTDTNFYYINVGLKPGKRIEDTNFSETSTFTPDKAVAVKFYELERYNLIKSGRHWMGEKFDLTLKRSFSFYVPNLKSGGNIESKIKLAGRSDRVTHFNLEVKGQSLNVANLPAVAINNHETAHFSTRTLVTAMDVTHLSGDSLRFQLTYDKKGFNLSEGWLDWVEIIYDQELHTRNRAFSSFMFEPGPDTSSVAHIQIEGADNNYKIWDITDISNIQNQSYTIARSAFLFESKAKSLKKYVVFKGGYRTPVSSASISNQDLHEQEDIEYLIITWKGFSSSANKLAQFHTDHYGRTSKVVYVQDIYNEFSSGKTDVTAIRDYVKMIYDRTQGVQPAFLCLLGDGSYDYKNITKNTKKINFVPTYQSREFNSPTTSYVSDDFYTFMEEDEGAYGEGSSSTDIYQGHNNLDIAVGRIPIESDDEGQEVVQKIIDYAQSNQAFGDWRTRVLLIGDHKEGEGNIHATQANSYSNAIGKRAPCMNVEKVFLDNYPAVRTADGVHFPEARQAMLDQFDRGSLIVNYTGHGGEYAWSNAGLLNLNDIQVMKNGPRQAAYVTATCEFGRWDDHDLRSGGELFLLRADGGSIAMYTTVRLVYSSPNKTLNDIFYKYIFQFDSVAQRMPTVGEVMLKMKNEAYTKGSTTNINSRNFTLLADPGLILAYPSLKAQVQSINQKPVDLNVPDTLKSLGLVKVEGIITDALGNPVTGFNGELAVTVFDKPSRFTTRLSPFTFTWQKNRIFNGNATVTNGHFSFEFVTPIDVSYEDGLGKISFYFSNDSLDGVGCYDNLYIRGTDLTREPDDQGPEIELYMNDFQWKNGGTTNPSPFLLARLKDKSGINTSGAGIGHEVVGILDDDENKTIILNDYYTADLNDFTQGEVYYQLKDLDEGQHKLSLRVWDVANNSAEATTYFIVASDANLALTEVLNYPNPVSGEGTKFLIGYNQVGKDLDVQVRIFQSDGRVIKTLSGSFNSDGNYYRGLTWDGRTEQGGLISAGYYVYRVSLTDKENGRTVYKSNKLVVIK